jgi:uncharacterized membrane protein
MATIVTFFLMWKIVKTVKYGNNSEMNIYIWYLFHVLLGFLSDPKLKATQAFMCMSLIISCATLASYIYWMIHNDSDTRQRGMTDVGRATLYLAGTAGDQIYLDSLLVTKSM